MNRFREGFHKAYPEAQKYYHAPSDQYTSMRFNDMYEAWVKATVAAMPEARIERTRTHVGAQWFNAAQHAMLRTYDHTECAAMSRAIAEGFRVPVESREVLCPSTEV